MNGTGAEKRYTSLKTRLMFSSMLPVIVTISLVITVIMFALFSFLQDAAKSDLQQVGQKYSVFVENKINSAMNYLTIAASLIENRINTNTADRELMQKEFFDIFSDYKLIDGSSIYFEPDKFDGKDAEYAGTRYGSGYSGRISYYYYQQNGETMYLPEALQDDLEFSLPHYTKAREVNRPIYSEPILHMIEDRMMLMFTLTYPIHDSSGAFIGAVTVDLFLEDMYNMLQSEKIYETGYVIIASGEDYIIYSPRFEDIGKTREESGLSYALSKNTSEFINATSIINGKGTLISISSVYIPGLDDYFYISVSAPTSEIYASGTRLAVGMVCFSLFTVLIMAIFLFVTLGRITEPIRKITDSVDRIAKGDYHARISGEFTGEFAVVKDSVNAMADSIELYVEESKDALDVLENILDGLDACIFVTKPETGEILFINEQMKHQFNITGIGVGKICREVLHCGVENNCDNCPCKQLDESPDNVIVWEEHNSLTQRDYRNTDCYINWIGGEKVRLQHSVDITDLKAMMNDKLKAERTALELKMEKDKAEASAKSKNEFLAKMSHEIRTPMNAVSGMTEMILRMQPPQNIYECAVMIKSACTNLLAIINDILDFSKIEAGMLEIIEVDYQLPSLINDVINVTRIRLMEKPIQFVVYVDPKLPSALIGDEVRIRQTITNILSNAVKYTNEGFIAMTITGTVSDDTAEISFAVEDSGIGIKEENLKNLFGNFVQFDKEKNMNVEGTGLGLAIVHSLCRAMGGGITVSSEYGKGSVFTATVPQKFNEYSAFATVDEPSNKSVLLYEIRERYRDSVARTLEAVGVSFKVAESIPDLFERLNEHPYLFISSFAYNSIGPVLQTMDNPPKLVLLSDIKDTEAPREATILIMPTHALSIANILNDVQVEYAERYSAGASFTAPDAKVLITDDVIANLKVAEGLLTPYEFQVVLCKSGLEAIELVRENDFDLVFMDHMMPEIDGIEAAQRIRAIEGGKYADLPIIALTANAVSGVREMFVQNGMNDFLAKPIEINKLNTVLERWIPKDKRSQHKPVSTAEEPSDLVTVLRGVPELSVDRALNYMGYAQSTYEQVVRLTVSLLDDDINALDGLLYTDLPAYAIAVHGMKGVLNNIGAYELGKTALQLEDWSKAEDLNSCMSVHPGFIARLKLFAAEMKALLEGNSPDSKSTGDSAALSEVVRRICDAAAEYDCFLALDIMEEIKDFTYGEPLDTVLNELKNGLEHIDYDAVDLVLEKLKSELSM